MGSSYNIEIEKEKENNEVSLSEMSYPNDASLHSDSTDGESLEFELLISAMLFTSDGTFDTDIDNKANTQISYDVERANLEECMEAEGLRYVGGFIARKFPQYSSLGTNVTTEDNTWIGEICRTEGKLMTPDDEFYEQLKVMEKLFACYHGTKKLKAGKHCMSKLSRLISKHVSLPADVIKYFVRCRVFFRMRILNRQMADTSKKKKKKKWRN